MMYEIYKRGQGRWSRGVAASGLTVLGLWAGISTYRWTGGYEGWVRFGVPGAILLGFLGFAYYLTNRPKPASFLIETEVEMKKVTWPSTQEVLSSTAVVIVVVVLVGMFLFLVQRVVIQPFLQGVGILPGRPYEDIVTFIRNLFGG